MVHGTNLSVTFWREKTERSGPQVRESGEERETEEKARQREQKRELVRTRNPEREGKQR